MLVLALDLSTHSGWAILEGPAPISTKLLGEGEVPKLLGYGTVDLPKEIKEFGEHPWNYYKAAQCMAETLLNHPELCQASPQDTQELHIVIEQTNRGRQRMVQKMLEFIHFCVLDILNDYIQEGRNITVTYLDSDGAVGWRTHLGLKLSNEQKKRNAKLAKAKREAAEKGVKLNKKALGIPGKITKKTLSVNRVNEVFGFEMKAKDNNTCDALLLGLAFLRGCQPSDGVK